MKFVVSKIRFALYHFQNYIRITLLKLYLPNIRFNVFSVTTACPSSCKCTSGQHAVDKNGNCNYWCSKYGYCGETDAHKNGVDCRGCAGKVRINV